MDPAQVMKDLQAMGTAQNRKVYARHGVKEPMFGVSYGNLGKLTKKIKTDQRLAEALWASGNHDARVLATYVADPPAMKPSALEKWARDLDNYVVTDAFSRVAAEAPEALARAEKWTKAKGEWVAAAGWNVCAVMASKDELPDDTWFESKIAEIEQGIHQAQNRVRHSMNQALISIGTRNDGLRRLAVAAAQRIGKVEVDHGKTGCKTPDAATYIEKTVAYKKQKAAEKKLKAVDRKKTPKARKR